MERNVVRGGVGWLSQTGPIPRSPDGDNNMLYKCHAKNNFGKKNSDLSHQLPAQFTNLARLWIQGPIAPEKNFSVWPRDKFWKQRPNPL